MNMATVKSYTDLEQSRKLAEFLPLESADACWTNHLFDTLLSSWRIESTPPQEYKSLLDRFVVKGYLIEPAWGLVALLKTLNFPSLTQNKEDEWEVCVLDPDNNNYIEKTASNPVDVCVNMILRLHELNML
jgi:hypothetical protein